MATYLILNLIFTGCIFAAALYRRFPLRRRAIAATLIALLALTAMFDNLIIMAGIVAYNGSRTTGLQLGQAPLEDFFYAIAAALLMPLLWHVTGRKS